VRRPQRGHGRLRPDHDLELRNEIDDELAVRAQRLLQPPSPQRDLLVSLGEEVEDELAKGLDDGRVWRLAFVTVALAGEEEPTAAHDRRLQLANEGRLANAGPARDE